MRSICSKKHGKRRRFSRWRCFQSVAVVMSIRRPAFSFDTSQPLIDVPTARALRRRLRKLNVPVPLRSEGRTAQDVERAAIVRLLSTLHLEGTTPPTRLVQGDRPDLVLTVGARTIGIEHTEAIPANVAHATALREQGHGPKIYFTPRALPTDSKKSRRNCSRKSPPTSHMTAGPVIRRSASGQVAC